MLPLKSVLTERRESLRLAGELGEWQPITVKFSGAVIHRERDRVFKGAMFAAYAGDLVFSKIDARNGAVGLIPSDIPKAVVTTEYPVLIPNLVRLRPAFLHHLLRAEHFKADLKRRASGTSGRKRVTPEGFLSLEVPVPELPDQDKLVGVYADALKRAAVLEQDANALEQSGVLAFESALGVASSPPLPDRPVFIAKFKELERWSHDGILRAAVQRNTVSATTWTPARLGDVIADLENGWSPKCHDHPAREGKWGVLKVGAVSFATFDEDQNKELPDRLKARVAFEVKDGDVLISRANVVKYVGACVYVEKTRPKLLLCDKIFRVRFKDNSELVPQFLTEAMRLPSVREQIEERLTGTSPTMKNISKPALLNLSFPLPPSDDQRALVSAVHGARSKAHAKRVEAKALRESAWASFESSLFDAQA